MELTVKKMDSFLKADKGWIRTTSGYEYIYDFHLKRYPIIIKVASSIQSDTGIKLGKKNKGSDCIRVFAVEKDSIDTKSKIKSGLLKKRIVFVDKDAFTNLEKMIYEVIDHAKKRYRNKYRRQHG